MSEESFDRHFQLSFGERWKALKSSMVQPVNHVAMINPFCKEAAVNKYEKISRVQLNETSDCFLSCVLDPGPDLQGSNSEMVRNSKRSYLLDCASLAPALALVIHCQFIFRS